MVVSNQHAANRQIITPTVLAYPALAMIASRLHWEAQTASEKALATVTTTCDDAAFIGGDS